jgi:hypothetical protein
MIEQTKGYPKMKRLTKRNKHVWYCMIKPKVEPKHTDTEVN